MVGGGEEEGLHRTQKSATILPRAGETRTHTLLQPPVCTRGKCKVLWGPGLDEGKWLGGGKESEGIYTLYNTTIYICMYVYVFIEIHYSAL